MHLGGGKNEFEQLSITNSLNNMAALLSDTIYGAEVTSFFKNTYDVVQFSVNEEMKHIFEDGVSIINFLVIQQLLPGIFQYKTQEIITTMANIH